MKKQTQNTVSFGSIGLALALCLLPSLAYAHVGVTPTDGLLHGMAHPISGLDHLLVMVAVGLWAAQLGGRALWLVPLTFLAAMAMGGLVGTGGLHLPLVEPAIIASILVLGLCIACAVRLPLVATSLLVGLFAVFHGHAHGTEMPETAAGLAYGLGFLFSTALLHGVGIGAAILVKKVPVPYLLRYTGGAITACGVLFAIGIA